MRYVIFSLLCWTGLSLGHEFPASVELAGKTLVLNGVGVREATIFAVDVYEAALYLPKKDQDGELILQSPAPKQIRMKFVRNVSREDLQGAWQEGFLKNCTERICQSFKKQLDALKTAMSDIKEGDAMVFSFLPEKLVIQIRTDKPTTIEAKGFSSRILALWLGKHPPNSGLKAGLLGQKAPA